MKLERVKGIEPFNKSFTHMTVFLELHFPDKFLTNWA